ncbi:MAG TPA: hypothetical protein VLQ65_00445 [Saliniramus sp.]|nr:hypothetical protein [Saliniramus sp.]
MPNSNLSFLQQSNWNFSDHDATSLAQADTGGNILSGLIALNAGNLATATSAAVNVSPVTQVNLGLDLSSIIDGDVAADLL